MNKVIWLRIPRTGTNATADYLERIGIKPINAEPSGKVRHLLPKRIKVRYKNDWATAIKFTFIRNPWDRIVSQYAHRKRKGCAGENFDEWLFGPDRATSWKRMNPQSAWYFEANYIGKFEKLEESLKFMFPSGHHLKRINVALNRDRDYRGYYTSKSRDYVADFERKVIKDFGYKF